MRGVAAGEARRAGEASWSCAAGCELKRARAAASSLVSCASCPSVSRRYLWGKSDRAVRKVSRPRRDMRRDRDVGACMSSA